METKIKSSDVWAGLGILGAFVIVSFLLIGTFGCAHKKSNAKATVYQAEIPEPETIYIPYPVEEIVEVPVEVEKEVIVEREVFIPGEIKYIEKHQEMLVRLTVYFNVDSDEIDPVYDEHLRGIAKRILEDPLANVIIYGHCDSRGSKEHHIKLSAMRGNVVKDRLKVHGVFRGVQVVALGDDEPVCFNNDEACWEDNRRATIVVYK